LPRLDHRRRPWGHRLPAPKGSHRSQAISHVEEGQQRASWAESPLFVSRQRWRILHSLSPGHVRPLAAGGRLRSRLGSDSEYVLGGSRCWRNVQAWKGPNAGSAQARDNPLYARSSGSLGSRGPYLQNSFGKRQSGE